VFVLVGLPAPVCTITANDGQNVAKNTDATPVAFTCTDNGDGNVSLMIFGGSFGDATLDAVAPNGRSGFVDYAAGAGAGTAAKPPPRRDEGEVPGGGRPEEPGADVYTARGPD